MSEVVTDTSDGFSVSFCHTAPSIPPSAVSEGGREGGRRGGGREGGREGGRREGGREGVRRGGGREGVRRGGGREGGREGGEGEQRCRKRYIHKRKSVTDMFRMFT